MPPVSTAGYQLLPVADSGDSDKIPDDWKPNPRIAHAKQVLFRTLALLCIMIAGYQGMQSFVKSSSKFLDRKLCRIGAHRNLSSLPSHFTLPSGDRIPSVALGTIHVMWMYPSLK